jgi:hypothetical protein
MRFSIASAATALLALTVPISALNFNVSLNSQVRLAYAGPTGMTVSWNTFNQLPNPTVMYGLSNDTLNMSASSTVSITYNTSLTFNNHVTITGLMPDTTYFYMPLDLLTDEFTRPPYSFTTARAAGDMTPHTVAVVIDMGTFGPEGLSTTSPNPLMVGEQTTIDSLVEDNTFEFIFHPGDIAYADEWIKEAQGGFINVTIDLASGFMGYESILDDFYDQMTPLTTIKPYMIGPGNHEANCDNGGEGGFTTSVCQPGQLNFTGLINHFRMPSEESGGVSNFWYSFDNGMVHYIALDSETDLGNGLVGPSEPLSGPFGTFNEQVNWLAADLAAVNRTLTPWVVVGNHRPWYSSGSVCTQCQTAFETLYNQFNVDLVINGHFHVYERMDPMALGGIPDPNGLNNPSAPWYITNGLGGHFGGQDTFTLPFITGHQVGLDSTNNTYGWSKLTFHNCTHMSHSFMVTANNSAFDTATLFKDRVCGNAVVSSSTVSSTASPISTSSSISSPVSAMTSAPTTSSATSAAQGSSSQTSAPAMTSSATSAAQGSNSAQTSASAIASPATSAQASSGAETSAPAEASAPVEVSAPAAASAPAEASAPAAAATTFQGAAATTSALAQTSATPVEFTGAASSFSAVTVCGVVAFVGAVALLAL